MHRLKHYTQLAVAVLLLTSSSCRTVPVVKQSTRTDNKPRTEQVARVVVLWSEAVLRRDNVPVVQGFAGKVYLYGPRSAEPAAARGTLTVYAYNETAGAEKSQKPDHSWTFDEAQLRTLAKKDLIGWSYSLWLPLGPPAGAERRCTLIARFTPDHGSPVVSESALVTLPPVDGASLAQNGL